MFPDTRGYTVLAPSPELNAQHTHNEKGRKHDLQSSCFPVHQNAGKSSGHPR